MASQHMEQSDAEIAREFQRRRAKTFGLAKIWVALAAGGFVGVFALNRRVDDFIVLLFFLCAFIGIAVSVFIVKKHYRCPNCDEVVWTHDGVSLDPHECPHCQATLSK